MAKKSPAAESVTEPLPQQAPTLGSLLAWTGILTLLVLLAGALISYDPVDAPGYSVAPQAQLVHNWIGPVGAFLAHHIYLLLGPGVWILLSGSAAGLWALARNKPVDQLALRAIGLILMAVATSSLVALALPAGLLGVGDRPEGAGGLLAIFITSELYQRFNTLGTTVVLLAGFWVGALLAVDQLVFAAGRQAARLAALIANVKLPSPVLVGRFPSPFGTSTRKDQQTDQAEEADDFRGPDHAPEHAAPSLQQLRQERAKAAQTIDPHDELRRSAATAAAAEADSASKDEEILEALADEMEEEEQQAALEAQAAAAAAAQEAAAKAAAAAAKAQAESESEPDSDAPAAYVAEKRQFSPEELRAKIRQLPINFAPADSSRNPMATAPREVDLSGYRFPELALLEEPEVSFNAELEQTVRDQAVQLESALQQYRIEGEVVGIDSGPVITLFEVRLAPGTKVSQLNTIASDLARALRAQNIRVVANMAGKDTVGIEVPNLKKEKVRLKELMMADPEVPKKMKLPMWLGKDASGTPLIADLTAMPHMLLAGTTGSGKSVCMNSIIMSFLYTKRPDELKLVLVDPKMVELSLYKDIPHLMCPVVTEMAKAAAILEWATTKMDERYELLAEAGVRDVAGYNDLSWEELKERLQPGSEAEEATIPKKLPYLVFIIDELADLMMTNKEVEGFIVRLAQKARAVGMHLILATQRPQANVVTGLIKGNMPCRISFKVASRLDSRIVLDQSGAEVLLGQGDMLYLSPKTSKLTRAQGTLLDDIEIRRTVKFLKSVAMPSFEPQLVQIKSADLSDDDGERDPLFDEAVKEVLQSKRGSVSLLQRRLTIGYSRASRMIEQMATAGILGDYKNAQAREVTMTLEEYEALKAQAQADADAGMVGLDKPPAEGDEDDDGVPEEMEEEYRQ